MDTSRKAAIRFIVALGLISLFADVTYEGARSVLGPFLGTLGATAFIVGFVAGFGEMVGYALRLVSGYLADKTRSYWALTIIGYILNLAAVPLLFFANTCWMAAILIVLERTGKAIRTPSRDVMLSQGTKQVGRGWGFGLHEAMDQTGAFIGPLVVAGVLAKSHDYHLAFAILAIPAGLAVVTLLTARSVYPDPIQFEKKSAELKTAGLPPTFWIYITATGLLAAGFVDFPLMSYHFQKEALISQPTIPIFYAVANGIEAIAALVFGKLFDRIGISALIFGALMSAASSPLVFFGGFGLALTGMALWGAGMGAQQSLMRAAIANMVPLERRGTAYGIFNTAYGILWFAGSAVMGALYGVSLKGLAAFAVAAQLCAIPLLLFVKGKVHR
jgi:MFS family permease